MKPNLSVSICIIFLILMGSSFQMDIIVPQESSRNTIQYLQNEEIGPWIQTNGPYGGLIFCFEIHPTDSNILYAAGGGGKVFKSVDGGESWVEKGAMTHSGERIFDLAISKSNPQVIYAMSDVHEDGGSDLFLSSNAGETWTQIEPGHDVSRISLSTTSHETLLISTLDGLVMYTNNSGLSWLDVTSNLPNEKVSDLKITGVNEFWVGMASFDMENGSLYHSIDGGISWQKMDIQQPSNTYINNILAHPLDSNIVFVTVGEAPDIPPNPENSYLKWTDDSGANWHNISTPKPVRIIGISPSDDNDTLYVSYGSIVYKSTNNGESWTDITPSQSHNDAWDFAIDPNDNNTIFIPANTYGILKSEDGGATWSVLYHGLNNTNASLVVTSPVEGSDTVYIAAVEGTGTFRTDDGGETWIYLDAGGITHSHADELRINPHDPNTVWEIGDIGILFVTHNKGTNWTSSLNPQNGYGFRYSSIHTLVSAPSDENTIYAVKSGFGIFRTRDGGNFWKFLVDSEVDYSYAIAVHPTDPNTLYSGYNPKLFQDWAMIRKSVDGGESWITVLNVTGSSGITSIVIDNNDPDTVYAGSIDIDGRGEIFKTVNAGVSWTKLNSNFTMCTVMSQPQLVVDPNNPLVVYAGTWLGGTWKTVNAGTTWSRLLDAPISATSISIDPTNSEVIYLSDRSTPTLWKSLNGGNSWEKIVDFSEYGAFLINRVYSDGAIVYCATFGPDILGGKLYKSIDYGRTWNDITGILPRSVLDIVVDPHDSETIYLATHLFGAYRSMNGGNSWEELVNFPDTGVFDIEIDEDNPMVLYACARGNESISEWVLEDHNTFANDSGIYKSIDQGNTWTKILNTTEKCRALRMHPDNSTILFVAVHDEGVLVSTNGGVTWDEYNTGLDSTVITALDINGDKIYVGTQGCGVYSGDINLGDYSISWIPERSNKPIPSVYSLQIELDPTNSDRIYVGAYPGGLFRSDDGGLTFYDKNFLTPSVVVEDPLRQGYYTYAINPNNSSQVWLGTWGLGVFKSYNAMDEDTPANGFNMMMFGKHTYQIAISPNPPYTVYAATEEGVFVTEDEGFSWLNFSEGLDSLQVRSIDISINGTLICGTLGYETYIYNYTLNQWTQMKPLDKYGTIWPIWANRPLYQYTTLAFHPTNPNVVFIGTFPSGIYKSNDGGVSWFESNVGWTNDGVFSLVFHPDDPDRIYAGTYNGVTRSLDGGLHWELWDQGWPTEQWTFSIDFDPRNPDVMYACSKNGENEGNGRPDLKGVVMKTVNGGEDWFQIVSGLNLTQEFYKIIVDIHNPDIIYLATQREGVFISYNGGSTWEPWNDGLTNLRAGSSGNNVANPMALSKDGNYLYFGTFGSGVFRRNLTASVNPSTTTTITTTTNTSVDNGFTLELLVLIVGFVSVFIILLLIMKKTRRQN